MLSDGGGVGTAFRNSSSSSISVSIAPLAFSSEEKHFCRFPATPCVFSVAPGGNGLPPRRKPCLGISADLAGPGCGTGIGRDTKHVRARGNAAPFPGVLSAHANKTKSPQGPRKIANNARNQGSSLTMLGESGKIADNARSSKEIKHESNVPSSRERHGGDGEDWKALTRAVGTGKVYSAISNHDLVKTAELRFSRDMREGDSGEQVLLLQRVLFWLGYLSRQSYITGYFGEETKKALKEFQKAHGVHSTGIWGSLSKQALWHDISAEILHRVGGEESVHQSRQVGVPKGLSFHGYNISQTWKTMQLSFTESASKAVLAMHSRPLALDKCGMALLVSGILFGTLKLQLSMHGRFPTQSVKRRILHSEWYGDFVPQSRSLRAFHKGRVDSKIRDEAEKLYEMSRANAKRIKEERGVGMPFSASLSGNPSVSKPRANRSPPLAKRAPQRRAVVIAETPVVSLSPRQKWQEPDEDELNLRRHIKELHEVVVAADKSRQAVMQSLAEERERSLGLEAQICKQREAAAALEGQVRELKESHDALLASLRKKFGSSASARTAAALIYQNWDTLDGKNGRNFLKEEVTNGGISRT